MGRTRAKFKTNLKTTLSFVAGLLIVGCSNFNLEMGPSSGVTIRPLANFSLSSDQSQVSSMCLEPNAVQPPDYGYDESNNGLRGRYRFDATKKSVSFERSIISSGTWNDFNFFPPHASDGFTYKLNQVRKISVVIKSQLGYTGAEAQCGLALGFGTATGHPNASMSSTSLRLANRDWTLATNQQKSPRDYFRLAYSGKPGGETFTIDAPINSFNQPGEWDAFTAAQWRESAGDFNMLGSASGGLQTAGDTLTYKMEIVFDKVAHTATTQLTVLDSSVAMTGWSKTATFIWKYTNAPAAVDPVTGSPRGGLDLTNVTSSAAMPFTDFENEIFKIGFDGNQDARLCEFTELAVTREN